MISPVKGPDTIQAQWTALTTKSGFTIKYQLFEGKQKEKIRVLTDKDCCCLLVA